MKKIVYNSIDVSRLLALSLSGEITADEQEQLNEWLNKDESHQLLLQDFTNQKLSQDRRDVIGRIDMDEAWRGFQQKIASEKKVINLEWRRILKYTAIIALPLLVGVYIFIQNFSQENKIANLPVEIAPGVKQAKLILSNGESIALGEKALDLSMLEEKVVIENKTLNYTSNKKAVGKLDYNQLLIGRGEEYQLILADGTKVWLNSESKLTYPTQFANHVREVKLEGEGYFEVVNNPDAPFIVKTNQMDIEVLGTAFNVSSYQDEGSVTTTLVEGSVKIATNFGNQKAVVIKPNEQAVFNLETNRIQVEDVDSRIAGSWRQGVFAFYEEDLELIMQKLSRWYKINVFYENSEVKDYQFSGKLPRFENCNDLLEMIEKTTNVKFEIKNNETIFVSTKN